MVLHPHLVFPEKDNLDWGTQRVAILEALSQNSILFSSVAWLVIEVIIGNKTFEKSFMFDEQDKLQSIQIELMRSRNFSDEDTLGEIEAIGVEFGQIYQETVAEYIQLLGNPAFSGKFGETDYPIDEYIWQLSFWNLDKNQFRIELDQQDRELPFTLKLVAYST